MPKKYPLNKNGQTYKLSAGNECRLNEVTRETLREKIDKRAHQIYLQRGDAPGSQLSDWLLAEKEIMNKYGVSE
jgi:hypothetical protein